MSFRARLDEPQRHFVSRLEAFGDIVIGFSMSQLALQLTLPNSPADLGHPIRYVIYFGTFAALAGLWLSYHRMLSGAFVPERLDVGLAFVYLAFTTIVPLALYANVRFVATEHPDWSRWGIGVYVACFLGTSLPSAIVSLRNYARGYDAMTDAERRRMWRRIVTLGVVVALLAVSFVLVVADPVALAGGVMPPGAIPLVAIGPAIGLALAFAGRRAPRPGRIPAGVPPSLERTEAPS